MCAGMEPPNDSPSSPQPFEDISHEVYPDRAPKPQVSLLEKNWAGNFVNQRCWYKVDKALAESPMVKLLLSALKSKGCEISRDRHICCEDCGPEVTGGYDTVRNQIVVCQNRVYTQKMTAAVIGHELIHMFDYCRAHMDFNNLDHIACSEVRAANLMHCSMLSSTLIGTTTVGQIAKSHRECVKAKALASILAVRKNFPVAEGVKIVDRVFDRCYNDLEPIGRRIRLNSRHMEWAYRERFHYNYDTF